MKNSSSFFNNPDCEYFPCHKTDNKEEFNCLFCYCPLYFMGEECRGKFKYTASGKKDCSDCYLPHRADSRDYIIKRLKSDG